MNTNPIMLLHPHSARLSLHIVPEERVCYAYLREDRRVVADVWLYNMFPSEAPAEWTLPDARSRLPFTNPSSYGRQDVNPISDPNEVRVSWSENVATLYVRGALWAILATGDRPGRCAHAIKDGPLARVLDSRVAETRP